MAKIYYARIKRDEEFTIINVPERWRNEVQTMLDADINVS